MTPCMIDSNYYNGDVILVPFPFTDLTTTKQRPALIISSTKFNRVYRDVIVVAITSHIESGALADTEYRLTKSENLAAGLPKPSTIKLAKIVTLDQNLVRKKLGKLRSQTIKHIIAKIFCLLG